MYEALSKLFTIKNLGQITSLKNELRTFKMTKDDTVSSYFVRISQLREQIHVIDKIIYEKDFLATIVNGLPRSWNAFATGIGSWKEVPSFE